ncbi:serine/threonine-protein kinase [Bacillus cereus]|uniref:serine/threonine-protein kinase n=1 Tax=Bacillus cereus TaxID=1396 RepID=UPI000BF92F6E|nr:serine/threonine-protein kinase [Bacillus cereus]PEX63235.1 serine/threonine protein kinase [Bacillus cereus]
MNITNQVPMHLQVSKLSGIGNNEGKNSQVWIAHDPQLKEDLILKEISKKSLDKQNIENYFLEAQILNNGKHPHVMPIRYAAEDDTNIYLTMPYYKKGSLNSLMDDYSLSVKDIIKYSLDFLSGILYIHIKGFLHLDVKPTNIVINDYDRAILTDFGLSKYLDEHGMATQRLQYNLHRSPESFNTINKTILDDIYQAGLTLYRCCNGNKNFHAQFQHLITINNRDNEKIIHSIQNGNFPNRKFYLPHIPKRLRNIINKTIHPNPDRRYQTVLDIINALSQVDENLDWKYNYNTETRTHVWVCDSKNSILTYNIEYCQEQFITTGKKLTKSSGNEINISKINGKFDTITQAFQHLEDKFSI